MLKIHSLKLLAHKNIRHSLKNTEYRVFQIPLRLCYQVYKGCLVRRLLHGESFQSMDSGFAVSTKQTVIN